jgi:glucosyl-dolichyl phosphate glucuronosyltransferase
MFVTVVICTHNRAESLRQTLESLFSAENLASAGWELLVVDNCCKDHTADVCREFQQRFPKHLRLLTENRPGKSYALNTAITAAKGDVLALTDDDVLFGTDYIRAIHTVFTAYPVDAAQGRVLLDCEDGWPLWLEQGDLTLMANLRDFGDEVTEFKGTLCGTNMIVRADVFPKSGGFAPELGPAGVGMWEDTEISLRMRQAGCRMVYAPQILVRHQWQRGRLTKAFIRSRFFGQGRAQAYYADLPVSFFRFGLYVLKETMVAELTALWYRSTGRSGKAVRRQCEARGYAGLWWQHWLFKRGVPRHLSVDLLSCPDERTSAGKVDPQHLLLR